MIALALYADAAAQAGALMPRAILYELIEPWADQVAWNGVIRLRARAHLPGVARCSARPRRAGRRALRARD